MNEKDLKSLKESIDTLIDENERLRKRIEILESQKEPALSNIKESEESVLDKYLKNVRVKGYDTFLRRSNKDKHSEESEPDLTYDPERDGMDWSYRPKRGTTWPQYWPYEVGDWPPGPQVGDVPPGTIPPGFPYWSILPPYWPYPYYWPYHNDVSTTGGNPDDHTRTFSNKTEKDLHFEPYTVSKTGEKIER